MDFGGVGTCSANYSLLDSNYQSLLSLMLTALGIAQPQWPQNADVQNGSHFDFIIVGAGSAGSVLANRLSEDPRRTVLLLEAGGDPTPASVVPGLLSQLPLSASDWGYFTENDHYQGQARRDPGRFEQTRGKVLGGSSCLNYMLYVRGCEEDFIPYAEAGFNDWNWDNALYYYKKSEDLQTYGPVDPQYHSTEGPMVVTQFRRQEFEQSRLDTILRSFGEIGFDLITDYNGKQIMGMSMPYFTHSHPPGVRSSTAQAFLEPIRDRSNLFVLKNAFVTKVIIDETKTARGVEVSVNGEYLEFFADKEVIVSAGSINSPKLLTASGIANKEDLARLNIDLVADLPVGKGLQDHYYVPILISGSNSTETRIQSAMLKPELNSISLALLMSFYSIDNNPQPQFQVLPYYFGVNSPSASGTCTTLLSLTDDVCAPLIEINEDHEVINLNVVFLHPKSKGEVKVVDVSEEVPPKIYTGYFTLNEDLVTVREGIKRVLEITNSTYFRDVNSSIIKLNITECEDLEFLSDEYWDCYALNTAITTYHPAGTCAMGSVVDDKLKVYGVNNLRVVDASVFLSMPSGNTNAPVIMFAEHAADIIKEEYGYDCDQED